MWNWARLPATILHQNWTEMLPAGMSAGGTYHGRWMNCRATKSNRQPTNLSLQPWRGHVVAVVVAVVTTVFVIFRNDLLYLEEWFVKADDDLLPYRKGRVKGPLFRYIHCNEDQNTVISASFQIGPLFRSKLCIQALQVTRGSVTFNESIQLWPVDTMPVRHCPQYSAD